MAVSVERKTRGSRYGRPTLLARQRRSEAIVQAIYYFFAASICAFITCLINSFAFSNDNRICGE